MQPRSGWKSSKQLVGSHDAPSTVLPVSFSRDALQANFLNLCRSYLPKIASIAENSTPSQEANNNPMLEAESYVDAQMELCTEHSSDVSRCRLWSPKIDLLFAANLSTISYPHPVIRDISFKPRVIFSGGSIWLLGRREDGEVLRRISDLRLRDRMFGSAHPIEIDSDSLAIVKAFSKAIDRKLFSLRGEFACANAYLAPTEAETAKYKRKKPVLEADVLVPYFWVRDSQIRGGLVYNAAPAGDGTRVIRVLDVRSDGDLRDIVPHRAVVYLGGQHAEFVSKEFAAGAKR